MGPGAPSADTPCGIIGGSARYVVGVCGFNSEAGSARYQPKAGRAAPLRGLSCFSSSCLPLTRFRCPPRFIAGSPPRFPLLWWCALCPRLPPAPAGGGAAPPRHLREREPTSTSGGRKGETLGAQRGSRGREKTERAQTPRGAGGPQAGKSPPAPCFLGSAPRRRGREPELPTDHHRRPGREGMAAEQARGRKSRQGANGTRGPTGRGGPLAPPCGIFFAFLGGCGHPPPRIAARGPTRARSGATTAAPPLCGEGGKPGPRRTRHRRPEGALYHGAKGGGPRTGPLRAPRPGRGGTPTDTLSSLATAEAATGAVWSEAEFGPNGTTEPPPARIVRARAKGTRRRGCGGPPPRASRPEPPRRGERGSASDSPLVMLLRSST